jgi:nucleotide-binding universal stress UspA family protein
VLAALDGESDDAVLECALAVGSLASSASYVLTRVVRRRRADEPSARVPHPRPPRLGQAAGPRARNYLARLSSRLASLGYGDQVVAAENRESVLEIAASTSADLIAVGTHGAAGVERLLWAAWRTR